MTKKIFVIAQENTNRKCGIKDGIPARLKMEEVIPEMDF